MSEQFKVANIKCQGCVTNIETHLTALPGVESAQVDLATGTVTVDGIDLQRGVLAAKLVELGYPQIDD